MAGAGIHCSIANEKLSYGVGDTMTFQFGASNPNATATNTCTMTGTMPDGRVIVWPWVIAPGGQEIGVAEYVVAVEDIVMRGDIPIVHANAWLEGYDDEGGGFKFYAEASATILAQAEAAKIEGLKEDLKKTRASARIKK